MSSCVSGVHVYPDFSHSEVMIVSFKLYSDCEYIAKNPANVPSVKTAMQMATKAMVASLEMNLISFGSS